MRVKSLRAKDCTKGPGIGEYRSSKDGSIRWAIDKRAEVEGGGSVNDETPYFYILLHVESGLDPPPIRLPHSCRAAMVNGARVRKHMDTTMRDGNVLSGSLCPARVVHPRGHSFRRLITKQVMSPSINRHVT